MSLSTPVAFFVFNRPDLTRRVFSAIAEAKPTILLVIADGPRSSEEAILCDETRAVIEQVDWNCEVFTNFSPENLGCGRRVASGIDWVFSRVEESIILEDDCLPVASFFSYCQNLLEQYRQDERVMTINGTNFQSGQTRTEYGYHFSKYSASWGWASWRRAWEYYDYELKNWPALKQIGMVETMCEDPYEQKFWIRLFDSIHDKTSRIDTWDHQWNYACWSQNGLAVEPKVNLVANLGFGRPDATHTSTSNNPVLERLSPPEELTEIHHPPFVVRNREADKYIFDQVIGGKKMKEYDAPLGQLRRRLYTIRQKTRALYCSP